MKTHIKSYTYFPAFLIVCISLLLSGCEKGEGEADYGFAYIYMPQATSSGGVNNLYLVPSGASELTYNFSIEKDKLNILLGVKRSGKLPDERFMVEVKTKEEEANQAIVSGELENAILLPSELYSLPNQVIVPDGSDNATFYLSLDIATLKNTLTFSGHKLVVAVEIANPDKFELSDKNTCTVVVIDVDAIRPYL